MNDIKSTAEYLIKAIVSDADAVSLETIEDNGILILNVIAPPEIIGQIIGKEGKIIKSIRTLLNLTYPSTRYLLQIKE
ncbi:KH domain-containing protein [Candidatus Shapirobacteria bacterium]|jgi:predicted RNA-binding protein YlqC (UPF0109 family)|nr:KH domain-containing protein [Candidatus Shapirobacteria bacterium]HQI13441.1 KH domain-containing protein [Candidatus Woesebacteria bacterium]